MRKFIITSACTLVLSLIGTLASNENIAESISNAAKNLTANAAQQLEETLQAQNETISDDTQTPVNDITNENSNENETAVSQSSGQTVTENSNADISDNSAQENADTDKISEAENTSADNTSADTNPAEATPVNTETADAGNQPAAADKQTPAPAAPASQTQVPQAQTPEAPTPADTAADNCYQAANGETLTVKNVDLSECDSINDVLRTLQENGYVSPNNASVRNVRSIEDIKALLQNGTSQSSGNTTTGNGSGNQAPSDNTTTGSATGTNTNTGSTPASNSGISSYADQVLQLVNAERAKGGLSPLSTTSALSSAANKRAEETVQSFSHTRPNGTSFSTVLAEYGISYRASGENIAYGQRSPQEVVTGWMNSPGHRANIMNSSFNKIGIGVYQSSNGTIYWSQLFTN